MVFPRFLVKLELAENEGLTDNYRGLHVGYIIVKLLWKGKKMFLTIMHDIFDIRFMMIMSLGGWAVLITVIGCVLINKGEQMKQDEMDQEKETISPKGKSDE